MIEHDNVREALEAAIEITEAESLEIIDLGKKVPATVHDVQEMIAERLYNIADLLGMSDLYVKE